MNLYRSDGIPGFATRLNPFLTLVDRRLRAARPVDSSTEYGWFIERTMFDDKPYMLPLAWFVTRGCSMDRAGACTMCNFGGGPTPSVPELIWQVEQLLERMGPLPMIYITPLGSMFDDTEVPPAARDEIFQRIARTGCRVYGTESRPETITAEKMARFRNIFGPGVGLQVGLGLESSNAYVRRNSINKALDQAAYLRAMAILKRYEIEAMVHVLLKPPFLTEAEAIDDAVATATWAWAHGADRIILLPMNRKPHTLVDWLAARGRYRVPYLWSGVEVLSRIDAGHMRPVTLSGIYAGTPILERAYNCDQCSHAYLENMQRFSMTLDASILRDLRCGECACREEWKAALHAPAKPLSERLPDEYRYIADELLGSSWWPRNGRWVLEYLAAAAT